jgi:signal recognition particle receptor subunit beta
VSFINRAAREINCKIVYYGPGLCGKTANLQWIFSQMARPSGERLISLTAGDDRTLFFDFLPVQLGSVQDLKVRFHLYTVPGQVFHHASRKLILRGVDGVVFVADSASERMDANLESVEDLVENLKGLECEFQSLPYVLQFNKRDLPTALPAAQMNDLLSRKGELYFESVASSGLGVIETLKGIGRQVLRKVKNTA